MRPSTILPMIAVIPFINCCASTDQTATPSLQGSVLPSSIPTDQLLGDWGLASFHQEGARARTEKAARAQCRNPYKITKGPTGGVMMYLADGKELTELRLKGGNDGKNYVGPDGPISEADREITSFDGSVMVLRWLDPDAAKRYGTMIFVRCKQRA